MTGRRLSERDRRRIAAGLADGLSYAAIARGLGRPTSTVTREVMRQGGPNDYHPIRAQRTSQVRHRRRAAPNRAASGDGHDGRDPRVVQQLADRLAEFMIRSGLPRMMARVLAALYTVDSGGRTSAELVQQLGVSPASISKAIGFLESQELIERRRDSYGRAERYVIDEVVWHRAVLASARLNIDLAHEAQQGAEVLGATTPAGARMELFARYLTKLSEDQVRSAEHWRSVYFAE